jgi:hypothetical protein
MLWFLAADSFRVILSFLLSPSPHHYQYFAVIVAVVCYFALSILLLHSESISSGIGSAGILSLIHAHATTTTHFWMDTFFDRQCTLFYFFLVSFLWLNRQIFLLVSLSLDSIYFSLLH